MSSINTEVTKAGSSRVWTVEDGVHPARAPVFQAIVKINDPSQSFGEQTRIEAPDPNKYNSFQEVGSVRGQVERPSFGIMGRYPQALSDLLRLARKQCRLDVFVLMGECRNPQDFTNGWEKILYLPDGQISNYGMENAGALGSDENAATNETVDMSAREMYENGQMSFSRLAESEASRVVQTINVCDNESCGDCGDASDGCQRIIAAMDGVDATPGTLPSILYSADNGVTWSVQDISTMFSTESVADGECVGENIIYVSNASGSIHWTSVDDLFLGVNTWTEVTTGFLAAGPPNAITSCDANHTWIAGDAGHIYFARNPTLSVTIQDAGIATTQNLLDIHAFNTELVLAVGALNAVVWTDNGGETWSSVTGPEVGVTLNTCWMWSEEVWFIGTATGTLYFTTNKGNTWVAKSLPGNISEIDQIVFVNDAEGFMAAQDGTGAAQVLRTLTGGYEWKRLPDGRKGTIPAADQFNDVAVCTVGANTVFAAGLDDDGTTGIIVKAEA